MINQPKTPPIFQSKTAIKSNDFINGTTKTFFGPRQRPDAIINYDNPKSWPNLGDVLRVPQVVWLTIGFPYSFLTLPDDLVNYSGEGNGWLYFQLPANNFEVWQAGTEDEALRYSGLANSNGDVWVGVFTSYNEFGIPQFTTVYSQTGTAYHGRGWYGYYQGFVQNLYKVEYQRLLTIFNEVKSTIEALRSDITFIEIIEVDQLFHEDFTVEHFGQPITHTLFDSELPRYFSSRDPNLPVDDDGSNYLGDTWGNYAWDLICPTGTNYFGTNFLNIFCGVQRNTASLPSTNPFSVNFNDDAFNNSIVNTDLFAGYSVRIFNPELNWSGYSHKANETYVEPPRPSISVIPPGNIESGRSVLWQRLVTEADAQASINADDANINRIIDDLNSYYNLYETENREGFIGRANSLSFDYKYISSTSAISDARYLIELIANHYNFDPDTGKDKSPPP